MYLAILSGILLALAYPVFNLEFLAFFAFIPLFFAIKNKNFKQAFLLTYLAGVVFWILTIYWLIHVTLLGLILLVLYLALYFGIFGLFFQYAIRNTQYALTIPAAWVLFELLRSTLLTGFPWALLGYSQYLNLPLIQIADLVGVWGVSFLVMLVNVTIYQLIAHRSEVKKILFYLLFSIFCLLFTATYGFYKLKLPITNYQLPITISLIQGSIPQYQKWDEEFRNTILERYETLTIDAARGRPDLIIWPETSAPGVIDEDPELLARILKLAKNCKTPILIGAVTSKAVSSQPSPPKILAGPPLAEAISYYNSAVLVSSEGKILQQYNKLHLVPFGEYVPLEKYFPSLRDWIGVPIGDFTPGREHTIFKLHVPSLRGTNEVSDEAISKSGIASLAPLGLARNDDTKFAVLICFEDIIPVLSRKFVKNGADFLVNITNDAWFMKSSAPYQHAATSVFRAVENRVPVVRAANTGLSCFIDRTGRIYDKVSDGKKDIFVVGYKTQITQISAEGGSAYGGKK